MIKIIIADDHALFRESLRRIIESQKDMAVIAEAENGRVAVKQAKRCQPDIILMDISMPEMDGINATRQINSRFSNIKIIGLSSYSEEAYHKKMMEAGASGYLPKVCSREDLIDCIRSVLQTISHI
jgi:DNA-binding NarL/FixJ family response regulator